MGLYWECDVIEDLGYPEYEITDDGQVINYDYSAGCEMFCAMFLSNVVQSCPFRTGHLLYSINAKAGKSSMRCWTYCEYAQYQEYGTIYMNAQPYFEPSLYAAFDIAVQMWDEEVENVEAYLIGDIDREDLTFARRTMKTIAIGMLNTILSWFFGGISSAMSYPVSPGVSWAKNLAENIGLYTLASSWISTGSQFVGTLAGILVGVGAFIILAPLGDAIFGILSDSKKRMRERQRKEEGIGAYGDLPAVEII